MGILRVFLVAVQGRI